MQIKRLLVLVGGLVLLPGVAGAAGLVPCSGLDCKVEHALTLFGSIFNWLMGLAELVAMAFLIWGALRMLYWSFMEDAEGELVSAKRTITRAVTGVVIVAAAWLIVNTVIVVVSGGASGVNTFMGYLSGG